MVDGSLIFQRLVPQTSGLVPLQESKQQVAGSQFVHMLLMVVRAVKTCEFVAAAQKMRVNNRKGGIASVRISHSVNLIELCVFVRYQL